jgi:hypothetical protein
MAHGRSNFASYADSLMTKTAAKSTKLPGKSIPIYGNRVKRKIRRNRKHFALSEVRGVAYDRHPVPTRGALAIVTNAGRGAVDAEVPLTKGMEAYGKDVWS